MSLEFLNAADIKVNERQRKEYKEKDLDDLADSIKRVGLIHAPVVNTQGQLIVGGRRLRALARINGKYSYGTISDLEYPDVPVNVVPSSDPKLLFEIELEENIRRVNLSAMEEAQAVAKLHQVRVEARPEQTKKDTAHEVAALVGKTPTSGYEVKVANAILVDQFKDDPEVQKAARTGGLNKAAKVARKKMEIEVIRALSNLEGITTSDMFTVIEGSLVQELPKLPDHHFDILFFDPPYGVDADKFGEQAMDLGHQYKDNIETAAAILTAVLQNKEKLKPDAHVLMFCSIEHFETWSKIYETYEFKVWPRPLIWAKGNGHNPVPDHGPRYSYESILFATRGRRRINHTVNDVFIYSPVRDKLHAAEKPPELLEALIDFVGKPGDKLLDPCCGSGSIFTAAKGREIYVTGIEISADYAAIARSRAK